MTEQEYYASKWHQRLCDDGWKPATDRFWEAVPCFYDLGMVKTVILFKAERDRPLPGCECSEVYYWKHGGQDLPEYLELSNVEVRRYKLHQFHERFAVA